jgi:hypothetical protein
MRENYQNSKSPRQKFQRNQSKTRNRFASPLKTTLNVDYNHQKLE